MKYIQAPLCNDFGVGGEYQNPYGIILGCGFYNNFIIAIIAHTLRGDILEDGTRDPTSTYGSFISAWIYDGSQAKPLPKNSDNVISNGWKRLALARWYAYPNKPVPWSFNSKGTQAVSSDGDVCYINDTGGVYSATFTITTDNGGNNTKSIAGVRTISGDSASDFDEDHTIVTTSRTTIFNGQEDHKFYGFFGDDLLHMLIKVNDFRASKLKEISTNKERTTTGEVRVPRLPNRAEITVLNNRYISVSAFVDDMPFLISGYCTECSIEVSGPRIKEVILSDNSCSGEIIFDDGGDPECWPPKQPEEPEEVVYTATASIAGVTTTKTWSIFRSEQSNGNGYWEHIYHKSIYCRTGYVQPTEDACGYPLQTNNALMRYSLGYAEFYSGPCPPPPDDNMNEITHKWVYKCCPTGTVPINGYYECGCK
jgi:hypothetical protein